MSSKSPKKSPKRILKKSPLKRSSPREVYPLEMGVLSRRIGIGRKSPSTKSPKSSSKRSPKKLIPDVMMLILLEVPPNELPKVCATNKQFSQICKSDTFREMYRDKWIDYFGLTLLNPVLLDKQIGLGEYGTVSITAMYRVGGKFVQLYIEYETKRTTSLTFTNVFRVQITINFDGKDRHDLIIQKERGMMFDGSFARKKDPRFLDTLYYIDPKQDWSLYSSNDDFLKGIIKGLKERYQIK